MDIRYRQAQREDIPGVGEVYRAALDKVATDHGFAGKQKVASQVNPLYWFCLRNEPEGFWVALDGNDAVVGAAMSWVRGSHWFLSHLFVRPDHQSVHVGRALLEKTFSYSVSRKCTVRSVITSAFNPVSIALYAKFGMFPQQALYSFGGMPSSAFLKAAANRVLVSEPSPAAEDAVDGLASIDGRLLGMPRKEHHEFLLVEQKTPCHVFSRGSKICGYAYVSREGHIGPMATIAPDLFEDMLVRAILLAREGDHEVSMMVPGLSKAAMRLALDAGLEIRVPSVLMTSQPFGDWSTYLYHSSAFM
jgi:GNAT superfamily N-acetyltransferase